MRPVLFEVQGLAVPAYGTTMVVLFILGLLALWVQVRKVGVSSPQMLDLAAIAGATILAWAGFCVLLARLHMVDIAHFSALPILAIGAFAYLAYLRRAGLPAEQIFDAIAPIAAFTLAVQYGIGTLLAGTAYGRPTEVPWAISFPAGCPAYRVYGAVPLHPVQLYLGIAFLLIAIISRFARARLQAGQRSLFTFTAIAVVYLLISPMRGNTTSLWAGAPRISELIAVFIALFCATMAWRRHVADEAEIRQLAPGVTNRNR
jgi:phosphatidylglycerol:prolipoprotein diacylglycerol transferase